MNKRHYEHTLPNIRGSLSNTYKGIYTKEMSFEYGVFVLHFVRSEENSYLCTEKSLVLYDCFFSNI